MEIQERLFALRDEKYAAFSAKLIPTVEADRFIGVRSPQLRALAKELAKEYSSINELTHLQILSNLPHRYHEENMLHAYLLCEGRKYEIVVEETEKFLPYIDNWAVCDSLAPRVFVRHKAELLSHIERWMASEQEYTVRFGIGMLMRHFLDADFRPEYLTKVAAVSRGEYYIQMMQAWYFATALAKQWDATLPFFTPQSPSMRGDEKQMLEGWVRGKSIQKALESYRVPEEHKSLLRKLKNRL